MAKKIITTAITVVLLGVVLHFMKEDIAEVLLQFRLEKILKEYHKTGDTKGDMKTIKAEIRRLAYPEFKKRNFRLLPDNIPENITVVINHQKRYMLISAWCTRKSGKGLPLPEHYHEIKARYYWGRT